MPLPVSSAIVPSCSGAPSTNAVPRHGWPANRSSFCGVKIRIRTRPALARRQHEDGLGEAELERQRLHRQLVEVARVGEDGELVAGERRVREDVGDDVAERAHRPESILQRSCA